MVFACSVFCHPQPRPRQPHRLLGIKVLGGRAGNPREGIIFASAPSPHAQAACDPLQNGLLSDRPHRHKVTRLRIS